jgi:hypothetical protein
MRIKGAGRRGARFVLIAVAGLLGVLLMAGCGSKGSLSTVAHQLLQEFPWLGPLGLYFIENLLAQYGSDLAGLLAAAAAALVG